MLGGVCRETSKKATPTTHLALADFEQAGALCDVPTLSKACVPTVGVAAFAYVSVCSLHSHFFAGSACCKAVRVLLGAQLQLLSLVILACGGSLRSLQTRRRVCCASWDDDEEDEDWSDLSDGEFAEAMARKLNHPSYAGVEAYDDERTPRYRSVLA